LELLSEERKRLLTRVSILYYHEGLNQEEITKKTGISRPQISRMLAEARKVGIVRISIADPYENERRYEDLLIEKFNLAGAVIINTFETASENEELGMATANLLLSLLQDNTVIGIGAGTTLTYVGRYIKKQPWKNIEIVPLVGGWGSDGTSATWQANINVTVLAKSLACRYWQLNAPAFVSSREIRDALIKEKGISNVLSMAKKVMIALVGVGQVDKDATIMKTGFLDKENMAELYQKGAMASICNSFVDKEGKIIHYSAFDRMIGLSVEDLRGIPKVIACAAGTNKVDAIYSVLRGNWINYLVTSVETAEGLLNGKP
jgi:DNA-binding transcriptional regulator LsrR (DeoR family)